MRTVTCTLRGTSDQIEFAAQALRERGLRPRIDPTWKEPDGRIHLTVGDSVPTGSPEEQAAFRAYVHEIATTGGADVEPAGGGVALAGRTPYHRELQVTLHGDLTDVWIVAVDDDDIARQLAALATTLGVDPAALDAVRPDPWPAI